MSNVIIPTSSTWNKRSDLVSGNDTVEVRNTKGKGSGLFSKKDIKKGEILFCENAVATARCLPLANYNQFCGNCGDDIEASQGIPCEEGCPMCFCCNNCKQQADSLWHHKDDSGLCNDDIWSMMMALSTQLRDAYLLALFNKPTQPEEESEEQEEGMGAAEIQVVQEVYTDCCLSLKLLSVLKGKTPSMRGKESAWTLGLSTSQREKGREIISNFVSNISECINGVTEEEISRVYDVCVTNSWPGIKSRHLFASHSLLNHACTPNAVCRMQSKAVVSIVALTDISTGSELCIDYTDGKPPKSLSVEDRNELETQWGHQCLCVECSSIA